MLQWILGRFDFSQNLFEMRLAKKVIRGTGIPTTGHSHNYREHFTEEGRMFCPYR